MAEEIEGLLRWLSCDRSAKLRDYITTTLIHSFSTLESCPPLSPPSNTMGVPFDYAPDRPEHIDQILNGLDRYNPETTAVFQDYVMEQCEKQTYDCYANLALLKLYVISLLYIFKIFDDEQ